MQVVKDAQIQAYLQEVKILPKEFFTPRLRQKNSYLNFEKDIIGQNGNEYRIIIRQNTINPLDFSIILGVMIGRTLFRLKRYNGDHGGHTNKIEKNKVTGFHIHTATQRYQEKGYREDGFAEKTTNYRDWITAYQSMVQRHGFVLDSEPSQERLQA